MTKAELIRKIAEHNSISTSEEILFFDILLKRCSEILKADEYLSTPFGKFSYSRVSDESENESVYIVTNENDRLLFDIPKMEDESFSVDSCFSISIGKPTIPLRNSDESGTFIPNSGDEMKRMLELKVERFLNEQSKTEYETSEETDSDGISDIHFSFLNWKKVSDRSDDFVDNNESTVDKGFVDSIETEVKNNGEQADQKIKTNQFTLDETDVNNQDGKNETQFKDEVDNETNEPLTSKEKSEDSVTDDMKDSEINIPIPDHIVDETKGEIRKEETIRTIPPVSVNKEEKIRIGVTEEKKIDNISTVREAFKYTEGKRTRINGYREKSFIGYMLAFATILAVGVLIYFSSLQDGENSKVVQESVSEKEFNVVIERSFDNPVTYPYEKGMFTETYDALSNEIHNKPLDKETAASQNSENISVKDNVSQIPEIREPLPASRIKGYIYQYEDGMIAVQVSSWKSKSIALSETQKFLNAGYNAFIEQTKLKNGTYYRVRIGGFKSLREAEEFIRN